MRQTTYFDLLEQAISPQRLLPYRRSGLEPEIEVHARYLWNVALCEALYPSLHGLEIALRNSIHAAASNAFGTPFWFDHRLPSGIPLLLPNDQRQVAETRAELAQRFAPLRRPITAGDIVAGLGFGYWTRLFHAPYERPGLLWPRLLGAVFPQVPRMMRTRRAISVRLDEIRRLRNRVFHHEPIWSRRDLSGEHATVVTVIGWISPALRQAIQRCDRFPNVHDLGPAPYEALLATLVGSLPP